MAGARTSAQRPQGQTTVRSTGAAQRRIASPRARVGHVFAGIAQLGGKVLRSIGLARARLHLTWRAATTTCAAFAT